MPSAVDWKPLRRCSLILIVALLGLSSSERTASAADPDRYAIAVLTFGPGDHPFAKFGHTALLVEDALLKTRIVYNYGTFAFNSPWLLPAFFLGKYRYWLSVESLSSTLARYRAHDRSVLAQYLRLSPEAEQQLVELLSWNLRPANKHYVFDYYRDNCSTRVRDLVDRAAGGALRQASARPANATWRAHTQALTDDAPWIYLGLYAALGPLVDAPATLWEEQFLPRTLEEALRLATTLDAARTERPLVSSEQDLYRAKRTRLPSAPAHWYRRMLGAGAAVAGSSALLVSLARRRRPTARVVFGIALSAMGLFFGLLGTAFLLLWLGTNHEVAYRNHNLLVFPPFVLWLVSLGIGVARGNVRAMQRAWQVSLAASACTATALLLNMVSWQDNSQLIAFALPAWLGTTLALHFLQAKLPIR